MHPLINGEIEYQTEKGITDDRQIHPDRQTDRKTERKTDRESVSSIDNDTQPELDIYRQQQNDIARKGCGF